MSAEEKEWANRVNEYLMSYRKTGTNSIFDIAVAHKLGFTPEETAEAIVGINRRVMDAIIAATPVEEKQ